MAEKVLKRNEVPVELTWDLSLIYANEEEMFKDLEKMQKGAEEIVKTYQGKLNNADTINACLDAYQKVVEIECLVANYAELATAVDFLNSEAQALSFKIMQTYTDMDATLTFIRTEIAACDESIIKEAISKSHSNSVYLNNILKEKPHLLDPKTEEVLSSLQNAFRTPYMVYESTKGGDIRFDNFEAEGKSWPLSYSLFEDNYSYDPRTELRRNAFDAFSKTIRRYQNVTAAAYNANVQNDKAMSKVRGYDSVFDYLLADQDVTREMYDRQIDLITEKLSVHMRKYAKLIQKVHKLDEMTFADLKLPLDPHYSPEVTIPQAEQYIAEGLSSLGEDYVEMIHEAFRDRWIDFANNEGKSTGGFCATPYGKNSFILLNYNGKMSDVLTLAHELGHAGHFKLCNEAQSYLNTNVSSYFVESPSTMNELLMAHYMLKTNEDKRFKRWVLSTMVSGTYYHNFVTHLLEAAYQREVYKLVDEGKNVDAVTLSSIKKEVLTKFWGEDVIINDDAALTWMRQPHYYMGLYSYTYSAGLTIATQVCERIEKEGQPAIDDWKKCLSAGATLDPIGFAKTAGVDITTNQPLLSTIETIGSMIDEIIALTEEIENA